MKAGVDRAPCSYFSILLLPPSIHSVGDLATSSMVGSQFWIALTTDFLHGSPLVLFC
jgi:hypothetical protein